MCVFNVWWLKVNTEWMLPSPILCFEAGFLTDSIAWSFGKVGWELARGWLGAGWGLTGQLFPEIPPVFAHPALASQMSTWTLGFVLYAGTANLNSRPRACTGKAIFPLSCLPATSVSARLFRSFVAHLFCTRTQPWSFVKLDSLSFLLLLCLPFLPLTVSH